MTLDEMIAVLQGQKEGKPVQKRLIIGMAGGSEPTWECMCNHHFNFHAYEYRLKPEPRMFYASVDQNGEPVSLYNFASSCPGLRFMKVREVLE